jgi:hypothetical protein
MYRPLHVVILAVRWQIHGKLQKNLQIRALKPISWSRRRRYSPGTFRRVWENADLDIDRSQYMALIEQALYDESLLDELRSSLVQVSGLRNNKAHSLLDSPIPLMRSWGNTTKRRVVDIDIATKRDRVTISIPTHQLNGMHACKILVCIDDIQ